MLRTRDRSRGGTSGGGAPAFDFASISGNILWLDSSYAPSITEAGGDVASWGDRSGNTNDFVQATGANKPTTNVSTINGKNALRFGASRFMTPSGSGLFNISNSNNTFFCVFQQTTTTGSQSVLDGKQSGFSNWAWGLRITANGTVLNGMSGNFGQESVMPILASTAPRIAAFRRTGSGAGQTLVYENGISGVPGTATGNVLDNIYISRNLGGGFGNLLGDIALILAWNRSLTGAEMNTVGAAIQAEWGVTWTPI